MRISSFAIILNNSCKEFKRIYACKILSLIPISIQFRFSHGMHVNTNLYGSESYIVKDFWFQLFGFSCEMLNCVLCNLVISLQHQKLWHSFELLTVWVDLSHIWTPSFWADYSKFGCVLTSLQWNTVLGGDRAVSHTKSQQTCTDSEEIHQISCLVSINMLRKAG
jgi:hypothetical protein